jgi:hypothetical protein
MEALACSMASSLPELMDQILVDGAKYLGFCTIWWIISDLVADGEKLRDRRKYEHLTN